MTQYGLVTANGTGLQVRTGNNNANLDLATCFAGGTAPSTTYAHQFWADTSGADTILKQRNTANDAWVTIGILVTATNAFSFYNVLLLSGGTLTGVLTSSVATGTAPFTIASVTKVSNLNVDMVDGYHVGNEAGKIPYLDGDGKVPSSLLPTIQSIQSGYKYGLVLSNNVSDANNDIDVAVGVAASIDSTPVAINLLSSLTKRLDATFSLGTNQGGLDTGSKAINTWYHVFVISKIDETTDILFSTNLSSPTMPTDFVYKRRIGSIRTDSSGNILGFIQVGNKFYLKASAVVISTTAAGWTAGTVIAPLGIQTEAILELSTGVVTGTPRGAYSINVRSVGMTNSVCFAYIEPSAAGGDDVVGDYDTNWCSVPTNTSSQIEYYCVGRGTIYSIGWVDNI